jgi:hypothetical protein
VLSGWSRGEIAQAHGVEASERRDDGLVVGELRVPRSSSGSLGCGSTQKLERRGHCEAEYVADGPSSR